MLMSMTGFGRATLDAPFGKLIVEIQSVNRKFLEIFVSLPKEFGRFELEMRKWISELVSRGQVNVRLFLIPNEEALLPDAKMLIGLKKGWEKISKQLGYDSDVVDLRFLMQVAPSMQKVEFARDEDALLLKKCVDEALDGLLQMKKAEGKALAQDMMKRLKELERKLDAIEKLTPDATARMREKLVEKMKDILKPGHETDDRLLREVALFAERVDVTEEITRLRSHFSQFKTMLDSKEGTVGRKMDFLIQEMGREVNTIGSKSMESKIAILVVDLKSELEKMREQIQNIE